MKCIILCLTIISIIFAFDYHGCTLAPDNLHGWVVCLDTILILHTTNGGVNWETQDNPAMYRFFDITCIDSLRAWTCGIIGEILHTEDGGVIWVSQAFGLAHRALRIEFLDENYGWTTCGEGIMVRTTDGGNYWDQYFTPWFSAEFYGASFVNQTDGWMVAGYPDSMLTGQGMIIKSTDGGMNWDSLYRVSGYEDFFDVHFFHLFDGIVVGGDESDYSPILMKTTDAGSNWNPISAPPNSYYLRAIDFVGNEGWAVGRSGTIIHSTDAGNTWTFQTNPATTTLFDVDFSDNLHGLACGYDIILYTTDGGQNWLPTGIEETTLRITPDALRLEVYPNPFRNVTTFRIAQSAERSEHGQGKSNLNIYDTSGRLVKSFSLPTAYGLLPTVIDWSGTDQAGQSLPTGVYFIQLVVKPTGKTPEKSITKKIVKLK